MIDLSSSIQKYTVMVMLILVLFLFVLAIVSPWVFPNKVVSNHKKDLDY